MIRLAKVQLVDQLEMMPSGKHIHDDSNNDQHCAEPQREPVGLRCSVALNEVNLLQKESEAGHDEAKAHQSKSGAEPSQKSSLGGQIVPEVSLARYLCGWVDGRGSSIVYWKLRQSGGGL